MKNPLRKGTAVTNATGFPIHIDVHGVIVDDSGGQCLGPPRATKLLGAWETALIGSEAYRERMILIGRATGEGAKVWAQKHPQFFRDNVQVLVRWNEESKKLELEAGQGDGRGRFMVALILRRTVKKYFGDSRAGLFTHHEGAAKVPMEKLRVEDKEPSDSVGSEDWFDVEEQPRFDEEEQPAHCFEDLKKYEEDPIFALHGERYNSKFLEHFYW